MINAATQFVRDFFTPTDRNGRRPFGLSQNAFLAYAFIAAALVLSSVYFRVSGLATPIDIVSFSSDQVVELVNSARTAAGLAPLATHSALERAAQRKAMDMLERDYFAHVTPDNQEPWHFLSVEQYSYLAAGENLAMDFLTAFDAHRALMQSPSHRANILNPLYEEVGIAVVPGEFKGRSSIVVVQFFGKPKTAVRAVVAEAEEIDDAETATETASVSDEPVAANNDEGVAGESVAGVSHEENTDMHESGGDEAVADADADNNGVVEEEREERREAIEEQENIVRRISSLLCPDAYACEEDDWGIAISRVDGESGGSFGPPASYSTGDRSQIQRVLAHISYMSQVRLLALIIIALTLLPLAFLLLREGLSHPKMLIRPLVIVALFVYIGWFGGVLDLRAAHVSVDAPAIVRF